MSRGAVQVSRASSISQAGEPQPPQPQPGFITPDVHVAVSQTALT